VWQRTIERLVWRSGVWVLIVGWAFVIVATAVFVGAIVQGILGFGAVIVSFPVLVLVEPELLPQSMLIVATFSTVLIAVSNRGHAKWSEVRWFVAGRPIGLAGAVGLLAALDHDVIALAGGTVVLAAIVLSLWAPEVARTPRTLFVAGSVSSLFGAAVSIGGPPMGLLYQRSDGPALRATVSTLALTGAPIAIVVLAATGNVESIDIRTGLALVPFGLAGAATARLIIPYFDHRLRPIILSVCAVAAIGAMAKVLFI